MKYLNSKIEISIVPQPVVGLPDACILIIDGCSYQCMTLQSMYCTLNKVLISRLDL